MIYVAILVSIGVFNLIFVQNNGIAGSYVILVVLVVGIHVLDYLYVVLVVLIAILALVFERGVT